MEHIDDETRSDAGPILRQMHVSRFIMMDRHLISKNPRARRHSKRPMEIILLLRTEMFGGSSILDSPEYFARRREDVHFNLPAFMWKYILVIE